jgi:chromosome segregation ATPase
MMWTKANKIIELQEANDAYANTMNFLNDKIGELESQLVTLRGELGAVMADLKEAQSDRDTAVADLAETKSDLEEEEKKLLEVMEDHLRLLRDADDLDNRCDLLELVLKQLNIPVTLSAKKK